VLAIYNALRDCECSSGGAAERLQISRGRGDGRVELRHGAFKPESRHREANPM
jgi:hypothetical protein